MKTLWKKWGIVASVGVLSACVAASFHWHPFEKEEKFLIKRCFFVIIIPKFQVFAILYCNFLC